MKVMVLYDSVFGNTEKIAQAISGALSSAEGVATVKVAEAKLEQLAGVQLLVVGSPTRGFRPTPAMTAFLKTIPGGTLKGVKVAAFDTRIEMGPKVPGFLRFMAGIFGYAAGPIVKQLIKLGGELAGPGEGFFVLESEGPLKDGELERAAGWAKQLGAH